MVQYDNLEGQTKSNVPRYVTIVALVVVVGVVAVGVIGLQNGAGDSDPAPPPSAKVACGFVTGSTERVVASGGERVIEAYRGIPFGEAERWQPPKPAACWEGDYSAQADGPVCFQWPLDNAMNQSENCLSLNVFTPLKNENEEAKKLPVFVWIYGGSLVSGSASYYGPTERLLVYKDMVLVTFNYRLSVLGFMALEELSAADPRGVSGNYGILDQQLALQWVQDNIESFGGDPNAVTVFGQSSGGTSIFSLLSSPATKGLLHAAISLSGSPNVSMDLPSAEAENARDFLPRTPCKDSADVLTCLRGIPAPDIVNMTAENWAGPGSFPSNPKGLGWGALAIVDGVTVTHSVLDAMSSGLIDVPIIFQNLAAEDDFSPDPAVSNWTSTDLHSFLSKTFKDWPTNGGEQMATDVLAAYKNVTEISPAYTYYAISSDTGLTCGTTELVRLAAGGTRMSPAYLSFVDASPGRPFSLSQPASIFPFHIWDYIAATEAFSEWGGDYTPTNGDLKFGALVRDSWFALLEGSAAMSNLGWKSYAEGEAASYHSNVISSNTVRAQRDFKSSTCQMWLDHGIGQSFWWRN